MINGNGNANGNGNGNGNNGINGNAHQDKPSYHRAEVNEKGKGNGKGKHLGNDKEKKDKKDKNKQRSKFTALGEEIDLISDKPDYLIDPVRQVQYEYDGVGNRTLMVADGSSTEYEYDAANRLLSAGDQSFNYDANGNLVESDGEKGVIHFAYTGDNKLKGVYYEDGTMVEYGYDAFRRKAVRTQGYYDESKVEAYLKSLAETSSESGNAGGNGNGKGNGNGNGNAFGHSKDQSTQGNLNAIQNGNGEKKGLLDELISQETTQYLYDGMSVFKEYGENGQPLAQYYEASGEIIARKMFGNHGRKSDGYEGNIQTNGGLLYYMTDAIGNVMDVTDRNGDTMMKYRYDAFGNLFTPMAAPYNNVGFTGKMYDAKASLMDFSARWYSPKQGRFTSEDTYIGNAAFPQSLNRYAYNLNNPVNYTDPTGHWCESADGQYAHDGTCHEDTSNYVPDCVHYGTPCEGDTGSGGSGDGGGYTPPPLTAEQKATLKYLELVEK